MNSTARILAVAAALALAAAFVAPSLLDSARATHQPANKASVAGSTVEILGAGEAVALLTSTLKTSAPTDLLLSVTLECSILTEVTTVGNDMQEAFGRVEVWVEIDGVPVGVTSGDDGHVVFCDRVHQQETSLFDDDDATIRSYLETRTANAFNWASLNVGSGVHTIEVKGLLTETMTDGAAAKAGIGKRTLVVEPTKLANDVEI